MARLRDKLVGHGEIFEDLLPSLKRPGFALTLLFAGASGVGKRFTARALAQGLLCELDADGGCGQCGSCLRVEAGTHESVMQIEPEGPQIKIDQARAVTEFLQLQRWGKARVVILNEAQLLNPQSANSLLKILEEPPESTFIFLIAPSPSSVLPTLRSRSRSVLFRPLREDELRKLQPSAPPWALKASRGSLERLRDLADAGEQELRTVSAQILGAFLTEKEFLLNGGWRDFAKERGSFPRILAFWSGFLRDALVLHARGEKELMNPDQKELLARLAKEPREKIEALLDRVFRLTGELNFHRDPQLSVEELWVTWRSA